MSKLEIKYAKLFFLLLYEEIQLPLNFMQKSKLFFGISPPRQPRFTKMTAVRNTADVTSHRSLITAYLGCKCY
jgi:hypothetical protein